MTRKEFLDWIDWRRFCAEDAVGSGIVNVFLDGIGVETFDDRLIHFTRNFPILQKRLD